MKYCSNQSPLQPSIEGEKVTVGVPSVEVSVGVPSGEVTGVCLVWR